MKRSIPLLVLCAASVAAFVGCSRSGMVDSSGAGVTSAPAGSATKKAEPARIAHGERVNLKDYVVPGKTTIFDFTSEYCPPCRAIAPAMHKLHTDRADIVVVEVDLNRPGVKGIDWQSPVAKQYSMQSIPHFKVYGPNGALKAEGDEAYGLVTGMLQ